MGCVRRYARRRSALSRVPPRTAHARRSPHGATRFRDLLRPRRRAPRRRRVGGRERTLAAELEAVSPPFRFSRMGPQRHAAPADRVRAREGRERDGRGRRRSVPDPGRLHVPRPVRRPRPHVRQDQRDAGRERLAGLLLQARSPSLDLDSLYGAGPTEPKSAKFYEADGVHLKIGTTVAIGDIPAKEGFDLPRGVGTSPADKRKAVIPDPRNDENLAVAQTHLAFIRFHNRVVDTLPGVRAAGAALRGRARDRDQALPVDAADGLPPPHLRAERGRTTCSRTVGRRSRSARCRRTSRRCRSSSRSRRSGSGTR